MVNFTSRPLYPRDSTPVPTERESVWDTETICTFWRRHKSLSPTGIKTPDLSAPSIGAKSTAPARPEDSKGTNQFQYQLT